MKKIYVLASLALTVNAFAQSNAIPNGGFESWTSGTCDNPQYYPFTTNPQAFQSGAPFNVVKSTDAYHGSFAVQLTTVVGTANDTNVGAFTNSTQPGNNFPNWPGGTPYAQKPTGMRFYYKSAIAVNDTALVVAIFKLNGSSIGFYGARLVGTQSAYTLYTLNFVPTLTVTPDTVMLLVTSGNIGNKSSIPGSMLKVDSLSFTGVSSQPAQLNGDFELWQTQTVTKLDNWYVQGGGNGSNGVVQTTDKVAGNYAVELITQLGSRGNGSGTPAANASSISTGYYPNNCSSNCVQKGGQSFSNQIDTLCFYYKYAPSGNDTAQVNINFKKNGANVWNTGIFLRASATYTYMEVPFNTMVPIDTVIVSFQSSLWQDSALTYVGSILKVDEAHFKSQPLTTGISHLGMMNDEVRIYPNPATGIINLKLKMQDGNTNLVITDMLGNTVKQFIIYNLESIINVADLSEGVYNINISSNEGVVNKRLVIVR